MSSTPLIGVTGSHIIDKGMFPGYVKAYVNNDYIRSVIEAGGMPVIIPFSKDYLALEEMLARLDGIILSGGQDISPWLYGQELRACCGEICPERDEFELKIIDYAAKHNVPLVGICRGHQLVNVYYGGTLLQDLKENSEITLKHWQNQSPELATHELQLVSDSKFAKIIGKMSWRTNSHHHQVIDKVGKGLKVTAITSDGVVEAMESEEYSNLITYQFHPEMMTVNSPEAKLLFSALVKKAQEEVRNR